MSANYNLYKNDIPEGISFGDILAIDGEFMGLNVQRDRLCLLQIFDAEKGSKVHIVQFDKNTDYSSPNLKKLLSNPKKEKIFYFARGDMKWIAYYLGIILENVYCLKIASRIARTYIQKHNLEDICKEVIKVNMSKEWQCTDWGNPNLSEKQLEYASNDVLYLHKIREVLNNQMNREKRYQLAYDLFKCLPAVVKADLLGWNKENIFSYHCNSDF